MANVPEENKVEIVLASWHSEDSTEFFFLKAADQTPHDPSVYLFHSLHISNENT